MNAPASRVPTPAHSQAVAKEVLLSTVPKRSGPAAEPPAAPVRTIPKALVGASGCWLTIAKLNNPSHPQPAPNARRDPVTKNKLSPMASNTKPTAPKINMPATILMWSMGRWSATQPKTIRTPMPTTLPVASVAPATLNERPDVTPDSTTKTLNAAVAADPSPAPAAKRTKGIKSSVPPWTSDSVIGRALLIFGTVPPIAKATRAKAANAHCHPKVAPNSGTAIPHSKVAAGFDASFRPNANPWRWNEISCVRKRLDANCDTAFAMPPRIRQRRSKSHELVKSATQASVPPLPKAATCMALLGLTPATKRPIGVETSACAVKKPEVTIPRAIWSKPRSSRICNPRAPVRKTGRMPHVATPIGYRIGLNLGWLVSTSGGSYRVRHND